MLLASKGQYDISDSIASLEKVESLVANWITFNEPCRSGVLGAVQAYFLDEQNDVQLTVADLDCAAGLPEDPAAKSLYASSSLLNSERAFNEDAQKWLDHVRSWPWSDVCETDVATVAVDAIAKSLILEEPVGLLRWVCSSLIDQCDVSSAATKVERKASTKRNVSAQDVVPRQEAQISSTLRSRVANGSQAKRQITTVTVESGSESSTASSEILVSGEEDFIVPAAVATEDSSRPFGLLANTIASQPAPALPPSDSATSSECGTATESDSVESVARDSVKAVEFRKANAALPRSALFVARAFLRFLRTDQRNLNQSAAMYVVAHIAARVAEQLSATFAFDDSPAAQLALEWLGGSYAKVCTQNAGAPSVARATQVSFETDFMLWGTVPGTEPASRFVKLLLECALVSDHTTLRGNAQWGLYCLSSLMKRGAKSRALLRPVMRTLLSRFHDEENWLVQFRTLQLLGSEHIWFDEELQRGDAEPPQQLLLTVLNRGNDNRAEWSMHRIAAAFSVLDTDGYVCTLCSSTLYERFSAACCEDVDLCTACAKIAQNADAAVRSSSALPWQLRQHTNGTHALLRFAGRLPREAEWNERLTYSAVDALCCELDYSTVGVEKIDCFGSAWEQYAYANGGLLCRLANAAGVLRHASDLSFDLAEQLFDIALRHFDVLQGYEEEDMLLSAMLFGAGLQHCNKDGSHEKCVHSYSSTQRKTLYLLENSLLNDSLGCVEPLATRSNAPHAGGNESAAAAVLGEGWTEDSSGSSEIDNN